MGEDLVAHRAAVIPGAKRSGKVIRVMVSQEKDIRPRNARAFVVPGK